MTTPLASNLPDAPASGSPFWSVIVPTYNPDEAYLRQTLESVLCQDPGPEQMQIAVIDDASPKVDVEALVRRIAGDRVAVHRQPTNGGLAANWNAGIRLARGRWVHLLHQDDLVLPGFYAALGRGLRTAPESVGLGFTRYSFIDGDGHWTHLAAIERRASGVLQEFLERIGGANILQFPAVVVRRDAYEALGGFRAELSYMLDWEMWVRIATKYDAWYDPQILASYRRHEGSETRRLIRAGQMFPDLVKGVARVRELLPPDLRAATARASRRALAAEAAECAMVLRREGSPVASAKMAAKAFGLDPQWKFARMSLASLAGAGRSRPKAGVTT